MTENTATTPPLGKILTTDEIARFMAGVAYPTSPVVLVDMNWLWPRGRGPTVSGSRRWACRIWRRRRTLLPETGGGRVAGDTDSGPCA
ncbi:hypothetical protein [Rhodococcus koreensis]|uniref:hypothetical protein n=1 Tax=Rhodococcus koreensis TaxID=99653 RepID=UPI0036D7EF5D